MIEPEPVRKIVALWGFEPPEGMGFEVIKRIGEPAGEPPHERRGFISWVAETAGKAAEFLGAVTGPRVDEAVFQNRLAICRACPHRREDAGHEYCDTCGCPNWKLARLDVKLRFANLACPTGRWEAEANSDQPTAGS